MHPNGHLVCKTENANLFEYILKQKMDVLVCKNGSEDLKKSPQNTILRFSGLLKTSKSVFLTSKLHTKCPKNAI
jgi:hypothetical protein